MSRIRTNAPAKQIQGSDSVIVKTSAQSMRQARCPRCNLMAVPSRGPNGQTVTACPNGHTFGSRPL